MNYSTIRLFSTRRLVLKTHYVNYYRVCKEFNSGQWPTIVFSLVFLLIPISTGMSPVSYTCVNILTVRKKQTGTEECGVIAIWEVYPRPASIMTLSIEYSLQLRPCAKGCVAVVWTQLRRLYGPASYLLNNAMLKPQKKTLSYDSYFFCLCDIKTTRI